MPIYEYECTKCNRIEEVLQKFSDKPFTKCKHCSGKLQKLISQSSFHLKGTGWYVTDYANRSQNTSTPGKKKCPAWLVQVKPAQVNHLDSLTNLAYPEIKKPHWKTEKFTLTPFTNENR